MIRLLNWLGPLKQKAQKTVIRSRRKLLERSNLSSPRSRPPRDFGNAEACCRYERRRRTVGLPAAKSLLRKTTAVDTRTRFPPPPSVTIRKPAIGFFLRPSTTVQRAATFRPRKNPNRQRNKHEMLPGHGAMTGIRGG